MNSKNNNETIGARKRGRVLSGVCAVVLAAGVCALMTGCESFRAWGDKSSSTHGTYGGSMSIPLGKGKK